MRETSEDVREQVAEAYAAALQKAAGPGVESGRTSCCDTGSTAAACGYGEEAAEAPAGAVLASFGCGNPLGLAALQPGQVVLDLGSGAGLDLVLAARKVGPTGRVIGVDMTAEMVEAARRHLAEAGAHNAEVRQGFIEQLPVADAAVDWVISNCVINLSPRKELVFREIHRVLRPGGRFSIADLVAEGLPKRLRTSRDAYCACIGGAITQAEYCAGLEQAGLVEVEVSSSMELDRRRLQAFAAASSSCGPGSGLQLATEELAALRVWSVRFTGRRPA